MTTRLVVVGDALLDRDVEGRVDRLCPDAPAPVLDEQKSTARPGGAALAATMAAFDAGEVTLVTALGRDAPGRELAALLQRAGVEVVDIGLAGPTPEKVRLQSGGRCLFRLDRGGEAAPGGPPTRAALQALASATGVLVSDYGRGVVRALRACLGDLEGCPVVWDPHPRGPAPVPGCRLVTPNGKELAFAYPVGAATGTGGGLVEVAVSARRARAAWKARGVAVTLGPGGALLVTDDFAPFAVPTTAVTGDACGAGDRFAAAVTSRLAAGALPSEAVVEAVAAATAYVAAGGPATISSGGATGGQPYIDFGSEGGAGRGPVDLAARVRQRGGTVVAAGGCFDLLHAGHVSMLEAARSLGDCLVVCLNSDRSVRRLKGPGRPVVHEADRRAMLMALACVDEVALFDEDTPASLLEQLRPHVFAKGGDYAGLELPEAAVLSRWGGQAVTLPYLRGRSTAGLLRAAALKS